MTMSRVIGRAVGTVVGSLAGPVGALFGFLAGNLIDQYHLGDGDWQGWESFLRRGGRGRLCRRTDHYTVVALLVALFHADRGLGEEAYRTLSLRRWPPFARADWLGGKGCDRAALHREEIVRNSDRYAAYVRLEWAKRLVPRLSYHERVSLLGGLVAVAGAGERGMRAEARVVVYTLSDLLCVSRAEVAALEEQEGTLDKTACAILQVRQSVTPRELQHAYRALARVTHPDVRPVHRMERENVTFLEVQEAYHRVYDQLSHRRANS